MAVCAPEYDPCGGQRGDFWLHGVLCGPGLYGQESRDCDHFIATIFFYSNRIWLLFPIRKRMSWEGHLFGFASGIITALYLPLFREYYRQLLPLLSQLGYVPPL